MNIITHALVGWTLASSIPGLSRAQKSWIVGAALAPDLDGLGIVVDLATRAAGTPTHWWSEYHHLVAHNLPFALGLSLAAWISTRRWLLGVLVLASVHLHLLCDLAGSRGPDGSQWPIHYLWPISEQPAWTVPWQWQLNAWPNVLLSLILLAETFRVAWKRGSSPLELVSAAANDQLVSTLRRRFSPF
jgi:hypothetical protein